VKCLGHLVTWFSLQKRNKCDLKRSTRIPISKTPDCTSLKVLKCVLFLLLLLFRFYRCKSEDDNFQDVQVCFNSFYNNNTCIIRFIYMFFVQQYTHTHTRTQARTHICINTNTCTIYICIYIYNFKIFRYVRIFFKPHVCV
jgi:hypothetical protein